MSPEFKIVRGGQWAARLVAALPPAEGVANWLRQQPGLMKEDERSQVALVELGGCVCYLKYYRAVSLLRKLQFKLGIGRPLAGFDRAQALSQEGLAVPRPLACLWAPGGMLVFSEGFPDSRDMHNLALEGVSDVLSDRALSSCAELLASLHRAGYAHGDCKWSNLLWSDQQLYLVDLDGVRRSRIGGARQARDIARFVLNAEEQALSPGSFKHFMDVYIETSGVDRKRFLGQVQAPLAKLRARHQQRYGIRAQGLM